MGELDGGGGGGVCGVGWRGVGMWGGVEWTGGGGGSLTGEGG